MLKILESINQEYYVGTGDARYHPSRYCDAETAAHGMNFQFLSSTMITEGCDDEVRQAPVMTSIEVSSYLAVALTKGPSKRGAVSLPSLVSTYC